MSGHSIRIETTPHVFASRVFLGGEELRGVLAVRLDLDVRSANRGTTVTITLRPDTLVLEGEVAEAMIEQPAKPKDTA